MLSHTAAFMEFIFFFFIQVNEILATPNIAKFTAPSLHSEAEGSRDWDQSLSISGHPFLANSPSQAFIRALYTYFLVFQLPHSKQLPT